MKTQFNSYEVVIRLRNFLNSPLKNVWVNFYWGKLYIRKSIRCIIGSKSYQKCFDLGVIEIYGRHQSKGFSKKTIAIMHNINPFHITFIESVEHPRLKNHLPKAGWLPYKETNYYKPTNNLGITDV